MKMKTYAWQLALSTVMVLILGCGPALAADDEPDDAPVRAEVKTAKPVAKAKTEKPVDAKAVKAREKTEKAEPKKEKAAEQVETKTEKPTPETEKSDNGILAAKTTAESKAEEVPAKPEASLVLEPMTMPPAVPAPQPAPQGLFQKFRAFFGLKNNQTPKAVVTPVAPATIRAAPMSTAEPLPLSSPPTGTTMPLDTKAPVEKKAAMPGGGMPLPMPVPPSLIAPAASPPPATPAVKALDPPNLKQAEKVAKLFDLKQRVQGPLGPITMLMMMQIDQANPGQMVTTQKAIAEAQAAFAAEHEKEMQDDTARFYAETFTADELQDLKEFYESPAGQKLMKNGDALQRRQSMFGNEVAMRNAHSLREEVLKTIKKYDLKPPKAPEASKVPEARK